VTWKVMASTGLWPPSRLVGCWTNIAGIGMTPFLL
jgi:hypothetical protein